MRVVFHSDGSIARQYSSFPFLVEETQQVTLDDLLAPPSKVRKSVFDAPAFTSSQELYASDRELWISSVAEVKVRDFIFFSPFSSELALFILSSCSISEPLPNKSCSMGQSRRCDRTQAERFSGVTFCFVSSSSRLSDSRLP
jgi:hypothetical protein